MYTSNPFSLAKKRLDKPLMKKPLFVRKDIIFMTVFTLIYAVIAFFNLGTTNVPQTYWRAKAGQSAIISLEKESEINSVWIYGGIGTGDIKLKNPETNEAIADISVVNDNMFRWYVVDLVEPTSLSEVWLDVDSEEVWINEIVFVDKDGNAIPTTGVSELELSSETVPDGEEKVFDTVDDPDSNVNHIIDERDRKPERPTAQNGMYFDELYHGRTALENLKHLSPYEFTHPPLGKVFIMIGIAIFGMNPFGWRVVGTLFGVLMVPVMYMLAKRLFKSSNFAIFATVLFTFDFMHFVQTRISTIDVYGVFFILLMYYFMLKYYQMSFFRDSLKETLVPLGLAGLFFGLGAASKWIAIYAGLGLAVLLFITIYKRYKEYVLSRTALKQLKLKNVDENSYEYQKVNKYVEQTKKFGHNLLITLLFCVVAFVIIPGIIYLVSYIPHLSYRVPTEGAGLLTRFKEYVGEVVDIQKRMFAYHSELTSRHPFESNWVSWIFDERPIWYYSGNVEFLPATLTASIVAMGNPIVWWLGLIGLIVTIVYCVRTHFQDSVAVFILVGFAAQFLPWMLITRATFIYHYFASVPFIILALTYMLQKWQKKNKNVRILCYVIMGLTVLLFILYYPAMTAMPVDDRYARMLEFLPRWNFYVHR